MQFNDLQKLIAQKKFYLLLIKGISENGGKEYYYIAVRGEDMLRLHQALRSAKDFGFEPSDYGLILEGGKGEPSQETKSRMEKEYGYNHQKSVPIIFESETA